MKLTGTLRVRRQVARIAACALLVLVPACASGSGRATQAGSPERRTSNLITSDELSIATATNLYDAIEHLRPQWFSSARMRGGSGRGSGATQLVVYLESNRYGTLESLRQLQLDGIKSIRYYTASEATQRFGIGHTSGAIVVSMTQ